MNGHIEPRVESGIRRLPGVVARHWKIVSAICIGVCIAVFGNAFVLAVLHIMHIPLGYAELLLELFFVKAFGLSHHGAEVATAYSGLFAAVYLLVKVVAKAVELIRRLRSWLAATIYRIRTSRQIRWMERYWLVVAAGSGALSFACLLMF